MIPYLIIFRYKVEKTTMERRLARPMVCEWEWRLRSRHCIKIGFFAYLLSLDKVLIIIHWVSFCFSVGCWGKCEWEPWMRAGINCFSVQTSVHSIQAFKHYTCKQVVFATNNAKNTKKKTLRNTHNIQMFTSWQHSPWLCLSEYFSSQLFVCCFYSSSKQNERLAFS